jgi:MinD-like ATPase involved in chromosome partitioning or flagellar assembly
MTSSNNGGRARPWARTPASPPPAAPPAPLGEGPPVGEQAWPGDQVAEELGGGRPAPPDANPSAVDAATTRPPLRLAAGEHGPDRPPPTAAPDPPWTRGPTPPPPDPGHDLAPVPAAGVPAAGARHSGEIGRDMLFRPAKRPPAAGWRRLIHALTGGAVNPGESGEEVRRRQLVNRVNQPIRGDYKIAVLSLKGGVGKTTTTVGLGSTFAALRGDHVVAADANPDRGTLAGRIPTQTAATVRDLLDDIDNIHRYSDVRAYTSQAPSRLEVLASERDPHRAEAFSESDYRAAVSVLEGFYNLILTDCGTGLTHSAMRGVLGAADALVLVSSPALDGAQSADATLTWLDAQGYHHLVERTVVVISVSRPGASTVNVDQLVEYFQARVRAVQLIPFDPHLAEGSEVDLDRMSAATREAFMELAALVADDFPAAAGRHHGPREPIR